jgi:hypothetical protein
LPNTFSTSAYFPPPATTSPPAPLPLQAAKDRATTMTAHTINAFFIKSSPLCKDIVFLYHRKSGNSTRGGINENPNRTPKIIKTELKETVVSYTIEAKAGIMIYTYILSWDKGKIIEIQDKGGR